MIEFKKRISLKNLDGDKDVVERLVQENLSWKLDNYTRKFIGKKDIEWELNISLEKNKKDLFNGTLHIIIDGKTFRYEREDYKKLDDLINNLFEHFKESLSSK